MAADRNRLLHDAIDLALTAPDIQAGALDANVDEAELRQAAAGTDTAVWSVVGASLAEHERIEDAWDEFQQQHRRTEKLATARLIVGLTAGFAVALGGLLIVLTQLADRGFTGLGLRALRSAAWSPWPLWRYGIAAAVLGSIIAVIAFALHTVLQAVRSEATTTVTSGSRADALQRLKDDLAAAVQAELRGFISGRLQPSYDQQLTITNAPGLDQIDSSRHLVPTAIAERARELLERMRGGSLGIAGARGVGKSTLIKSLCGPERIVDSHRTRPDLAIYLPAPVQYDARDFLLHIFSAMCGHLIRARPDLRVESSPPPGRSAATRAILIPLAVTLVAIGILAAGIALVWLGASIGQAAQQQSFSNPSPTPPPLTTLWHWTLQVLAAFAGLLCVLFGLAQTGVGSRFRSLEPVSARTGSHSLILGAGLVLIAAAIADFIVVQIGAFPNVPLAAGIYCIGGSVGLLVYLAPDGSRLWLRRVVSRSRRAESHLRFDDSVIEQARDQLQAIRYQQSTSLGWTRGAKTPAALPLPLSVEAAKTRNSTLSRLPVSLPELVTQIRDFMQLLTDAGHRVLIGIDELDKIESEEKAGQLLNDLKTIFGVPGCHFLVAVSEDAMASFERRGMPFRDVFDSTFDEIVRVPALTYSDSRRVLLRRVIGMSEPYLALCYCLSGGLARDLIRAARLVVRAGRHTPGDLASVCQFVIRDDVAAKIDAIARAVSRCTPSPLQETALDWIDGGGPPRTAGELIGRCRELATILGLRELANGTEQAVVRRLLADLSTHYYFCATLIQFFDSTLTQEALVAALAPRTLEPGTSDTNSALEMLAGVRPALAVSASIAWSRVSAFRRRWTTVEEFPFTVRRVGRLVAPENGRVPR